MIIVLKKGAPQQEIDKLHRRIEELENQLQKGETV